MLICVRLQAQNLTLEDVQHHALYLKSLRDCLLVVVERLVL